jgi:leucyl aminopeptidase
VLEITAAAGDPLKTDVDLLVVPVFKGGIEGPGANAALEALGLSAFPVTPQFRGDIGQHLLLVAPGLAIGGLLLVGLGRMDEVDPERLRRAAGVAAGAASKAETVATTLAEVLTSRAAFSAVAEGFHLGAYADRRHKSDPEEGAHALRRVIVFGPSSRMSEAKLALQQADRYARATIAARDLVNLPPDRKRPPALAKELARLCKPDCEVTIHDEEWLAAEGFGGTLAVGQGSEAPPRLVEIRYRPRESLGHIVLVGKGITFDTGGLSLKRGTSMDWMKADMAGAAAIAAACSALRALKVPLEVTGLLPLAENMPSGQAQRPGDVIRIFGGKTVEVRDTDAEGRLILADALAYAARMEPEAIVDLATLTGSVITALGQYAAGLMSNDPALADGLQQAGKVAGEDLWPLPLWSRLERFLDTPIADVNNTADGPGAGSITAGMFLQRFVGEVPWAHLDIAGPAFLESRHAEGYLGAGGTGFGVRTLLSWLERRAA